MFPLTITTVQDETDLALLLDFMRKQPQYYDHYEDWLFGKCQARMESGRYKPIIAISEGVVIGDSVYQFLPDGTVEIKNFRIDPHYQNRSLGRFLMRQVQVETEDAPMQLDVSIDNFEGVEFFIHQGFHIVKRDELYSPNRPDYLMRRSIN
ncbi:GNAT family N-acetyltransferase [Candidatus Woesearchaeota archaeon]|jgi:ribosomal protein S18 acetylase RimI-like enzyme|nr:GNAT family N-acetyltransferase [Candidatus Woesearchaeota archaeon]